MRRRCHTQGLSPARSYVALLGDYNEGMYKSLIEVFIWLVGRFPRSNPTPWALPSFGMFRPFPMEPQEHHGTYAHVPWEPFMLTAINCHHLFQAQVPLATSLQVLQRFSKYMCLFELEFHMTIVFCWLFVLTSISATLFPGLFTRQIKASFYISYIASTFCMVWQVFSVKLKCVTQTFSGIHCISKRKYATCHCLTLFWSTPPHQSLFIPGSQWKLSHMHTSIEIRRMTTI